MTQARINHPLHGGQLDVYAKHYGINKSQWLDLSTGINPNAYPQQTLPDYVLRDLPNEDDGLEQAAYEYYGCNELLMVPGSSWAIQYLPEVLCQQNPAIKRILLPRIGYSEHMRAWQKQSMDMDFYTHEPSLEQLTQCDVCVLINPNNPSTHLVPQDVLLNMAAQLNKHSGILIVDEAFMDSQPQHSVIQNRADNVIVLRSLGKFFGLAGLRMGSVMASTQVLTLLQSHLPPWALSHPARFIAQHALSHTSWIYETRQWLAQQSLRLEKLCQKNLVAKLHSTTRIFRHDLFVTLFFTEKHHALTLHHHLCEQGIYTRLLDHQMGIRMGLPQDTIENWQRLETSLACFNANNIDKETRHVTTA